MLSNHYQSTSVNRLISEIDDQSMRENFFTQPMTAFLLIIVVYLSVVYYYVVGLTFSMISP